MRIYNKTDEREAGRRGGVFKAFPPGKNTLPNEKRFDTIEELAVFLIKNPKWKVWLKGNDDKNDGQLSSDIVIEGKFDRDHLISLGIL